MRHIRRFLFATVIAGSAAVFVLLYPRMQSPDDGVRIEVPFQGEDGEIQQESSKEAEVPWPSPPSASPLTSEPPSVVREPNEPNAVEVFRDINTSRKAVGLPSVVFDDTLTAVANLHVDDMARRSYFSHVTPEGVSFEMRIDASGYSYLAAAENLGFASHPSLIVPDWMRSPPHRANIEDARMRRVGVATAPGMWQGIKVVYTAAVFAVPR